MKQYVCEKGHLFLFPAIRTIADPMKVYADMRKTWTGDETPQPVEYKSETQYHVCPECMSLDISEAPEDQITSVISVDISDVDIKLKGGYVIENLYQKTATLVKREAKQP